MNNEEITVPIAIVRSGHSEKYVEIIKNKQQARNNSHYYSDQLESLYSQIKKQIIWDGNGRTKKYVAEIRRDYWKEALVIKEISDKIIETAGLLAEWGFKYEEYTLELEKMEKGDN